MMGLFIVAFGVAWFFSPEEERAVEGAHARAAGHGAVVQSAADSSTPETETGLKKLVRDKAYPGFTLFGESGSALVKLLDMTGRTVHQWDFDAARTRLLENCNVLVVHGTKWGWSQDYWKKQRPIVREFTWEGEKVWEHEVPGPAHHDIHRLENGNTLLLYRSEVPKNAKQSIEDPDKRNARIRTDVIREVSPEGEVVWEWNAHDHLDLNRCGVEGCKNLPDSIITQRRVFDWTHANGIRPIPENRWAKLGDPRFKPGNIILSLRNWSMAVIIDRDTGEVVWEYGGPEAKPMSGIHEAFLIPEGLPGAGNILIFDNGKKRGNSRILEIDPVTLEVKWMYEKDGGFYSRAAGRVQRLPNGNTLVSEDVPGRLFELTPEKERVWEYHAGLRTARAHRYEQNYCPKLKELELFSG